jgi:hypothetical protein
MDRDVEEEFKNEWLKCFSKSRRRDYYYNSQTKKSVWTKEEVYEIIKAKQSLLNDKNERKM